MKAAVLLKTARRLSDDATPPYYIDDPEMYQFLSTAQEDFCRESRCLRDVRTWTTELIDPEDEDAGYDKWIPLNEDGYGRIIDIRRAWYIDSNNQRKEIGCYTSGDRGLIAAAALDDDYGRIRTYLDDTDTGEPEGLILGRKTGYIEVVPTPDAAYTIEVEAIVYPTDALASPDDVPEIPDEYHRWLPYGAAFLATQGVEAEHYDPARVKSISDAWLNALTQARDEIAAVSKDIHAVMFPRDGVW